MIGKLAAKPQTKNDQVVMKNGRFSSRKVKKVKR